MKLLSDLMSHAQLAARVLQAVSRSHKLAYAQIAPDLTIAHASPNLAEMIAAPPGPLEGRALADVLWAFVGAEDALTDVIAGRSADYLIEQLNRERPDGSLAYLTLQAIPLQKSASQAGLLLIVEDVTETSRLQQEVTQDRNELRLLQAQLAEANEELRQLSRFKTFMISMVAHDVRSPLSTIHGYVSMLLDALARGEPVDREFLLIVAIQADRINQMLSNLLNLDQIERGQLAVNPVPSDLNALAEEAAASMQAMASLRQVSIQLDADPDPVEVRVDPDRIQQILQNLIGNAVKYSPAGGRVVIAVRSGAKGAELRVTDTGPGMTEDELAQLFRPFYRTAEARESDVLGTGLGLYIVKMLVEAQQGTVEAASRPGQGATFTVRLPLHRGA